MTISFEDALKVAADYLDQWRDSDSEAFTPEWMKAEAKRLLKEAKEREVLDAISEIPFASVGLAAQGWAAIREHNPNHDGVEEFLDLPPRKRLEYYRFAHAVIEGYRIVGEEYAQALNERYSISALPMEARVFSRGEHIPADVAEIMSADGHRYVRTPAGLWLSDVLREHKDDPAYGFPAEMFWRSEFPLTEVI
ncbi:hypothetical protein L3Y25_gp047 [Gordonia phage Syleon]|uniref:Uncharacterized protein n=1 Tax=Gordonia phage Syleon TaxID=2653718 RepID=A0A5Q2WBD8_9CAUD|nr:hypothetical protein L3Y25_gp047 [Gordonia phage Syleon]QGH75776.1 hypothetical protein SEA_SYLEON_47 [Gordonia phage Syleon]